MNKQLIIITIVGFLVALLFFGVIAIAYWDDNQEKAPCNYWKLKEWSGYSINDTVSWNKRIECGLIEDANVLSHETEDKA